MKIRLTRSDIKQHAEALERIEKLEAWHHGTNSCHRIIQLGQLNSQFSMLVKCGWCCTSEDEGRHEEEIFRKHMDAAIEEALAYWKQRAELSE